MGERGKIPFEADTRGEGREKIPSEKQYKIIATSFLGLGKKRKEALERD